MHTFTHARYKGTSQTALAHRCHERRAILSESHGYQIIGLQKYKITHKVSKKVVIRLHLIKTLQAEHKNPPPNLCAFNTRGNMWEEEGH